MSRYAGLPRVIREAPGRLPRDELPRRAFQKFSSEESFTYQVAEADRIDILALRFLGDVRLWWVIADANDLADTMALEVGAEIRIPTVEAVRQRVGL